jgi:hypothetical protein
MLKTLLVTTALLWPLATFAADDVPIGPAPKLTPDPQIQTVITKLCVMPLTPEIAHSLQTEFNLGYAYDIPLPPNYFVRNLVLETKISGQTTGGKEVVVLTTFFQDSKPIEQCIGSFGVFEPKKVEDMKQAWGKGGSIPDSTDKSEAAPAPTTPPAGSAPVPNFKANPDE